MTTHSRLRAVLAGLLTLVLAGAGTASAQVVISQSYGGGGNSGATYTHDFIELFNRGSTPVSLAGWSVQYTSAAGTSWQVTPLGSH
ncbi:MAG: lamin tail domain-containing protein, partial [Lysobacteraceae bacterium]